MQDNDLGHKLVKSAVVIARGGGNYNPREGAGSKTGRKARVAFFGVDLVPGIYLLPKSSCKWCIFLH